MPDKRCVPQCEEGTFEATPGICALCNKTCKTCARFGSRACINCPSGFMLLKNNISDEAGVCLEGSNCPEKTFKLNEKECSNCSAYCKRCTSSKAFHCLECVAEGFKHTSTNICHPYCLPNYVESAPKICSPCHLSCQDCLGVGYDQCMTCKENGVFKPTTPPNGIVGKCLPATGYFIAEEYSP
jgi:hypothetical protein